MARGRRGRSRDHPAGDRPSPAHVGARPGEEGALRGTRLSNGVILYGAGSPILADVADSCARLGRPVVAIVQNRPGAAEPGFAVLQPAELTSDHLALCFAIPLFGPANREAALAEVSALGARRFDPLVDPRALMPTRATVEEGAYINSGVMVGSHARIGRFAFVNRGALIGHQAELEAFVSVAPGANIGSHAHIGRGAVIDTGAVIASGVTVGAGAVVGVGVVVREDVLPGARL